MPIDFQQLADEDFCYLSTTGRVSGRSHTIEIWFALDGNILYMLAGGREQADWVKNVQYSSQVQVKIGAHIFHGQARILAAGEEDIRARKLVADKYVPHNNDLEEWLITSLPVAVDVRI